MRTHQQQQLRSLLNSRAINPRELMQGLNVSQPTLSRLISSMSGEIVVMGKGRATRYGLPRKIHGQEGRFPVYCVDPRGDAHLHGTLTALQGGQYWWEENKEGGELYDSLPWFLLDQQLPGFGSRSFAYRESEALGPAAKDCRLERG